MWDLGNRGVVALISVLSGCVFLYNVWEPIFVVTISLFLVVYACYSLIINDSLLSPHAFLLFEYSKQAALEVRAKFESIVDHVYRYARESWESVNHRYRERFLTRMERRRGSNYQLSSDSYPATRNSSGFDMSAQLSPIPRSTYKTLANDTGSENKFYHDPDASSYDHSPFGKHTSTPMFRQSKDNSENSEVDSLSTSGLYQRKQSPMYVQNHTLTRGENTTYFSPEGSPWGTSISPKMRPKAGGVKTVQTVAGPLLASTRYNIDPKIYNDITSPGLTTRLTKYATEANTKLTHQSQYCTGQFPKVNLHASPVPLINAKSVKMRMPVTVRVAPPDTTRYSPPGRQKVLSNFCQLENKSPPSVAQVLREISLKRHASREDVASDLAKKQRTDGIVCDEFETLDEMKQKRSREESSKSEEDISPQNKTIRPTKRTKTPSCYDILNSLSSSKHVASGVKRKAIDFSRSGTPDFEKHFKSLESVQNNSIQALAQSQNVKTKLCTYDATEKPVKNSDIRSSPNKLQEHTPIKGILKTSSRSSMSSPISKDIQPNCNGTQNIKTPPIEPTTSTESVRLTDKLFMRAEPQRNEKLRLLVEEQGSIKAKFTTDDVEKIKKEDIVNMRKTSMKARLQSMFDAISGKAASRINPDVVIQAEEVNVVKPATSPATCATLNSSTTTTNVNTTPISTSAVVPGISGNESNTKSTKHVAFNIPSKEPLSSPNVPVTSTSETKAENVSPVKLNTVSSISRIAFTTTPGITTTPSAPNTSMSSTNSNVPNFAFGKPSSSTAASVSPSGAFSFGAVSSNNSSITSTCATLLPTASAPATLFGSVSNTTPKPTPISQSSNELGTKTESHQSNAINTSQTISSAIGTPMGSNFTFGSTSVTSTSMSAPMSTSTTMNIGIPKMQSIGTTSTTNANAMSSFKSITAASSASPSVSTVTPISTPSLFAFGNKSSNLQSSKPESFVVNSSGSIVPSANTFGNLTSPQQISTMGNSMAGTNSVPAQAVSTPNTCITAVNSNAKSTASTFGSSTAISTFTFGTPASSTSSNKPGFSFGTAATSTPSVLTGTVNTSSAFGTPNRNAILPFGTSSATTTPQFSSTTTSIFGSTTSASIFGSTTNQPVFGAPSTSGTTGGFGTPTTSGTTGSFGVSTTSGTTGGFGTPKTTAPSIFGSTPNTPSTGLTSTNPPPVFSNINGSSGIATTNPPPVFGSNANVSASGIASTSSNLFSNSSANVNANPTTSTATFTTTNNIFGQTKSPSASFGTSTGVFGNNATSLFGSQTTATSNFGATNVTSNATAPTFGSTNVSTAVTVVPTFGATNNAPPAFGAPRNVVAPGAQNPTTQAFGAGASIFGTDNPPAPIFGATTTGGFNTTAQNAFGGQNTNIGFGSTNNTATFGENKSSPFGAQSTAPSSAFGAPSASVPAFGTGNANSGSNNANNIFTFGGNQKPLQQNSSFSFGGNNTGNNNATASTSTPFQFGASTSKPATGFNFSAPSTTPSINFGTPGTPTFNASTPGMFSIGSGSTAPRSRNVRTRKPR